MPIYEYICHRNGVTAEVLHPMADRVDTWGRLCELTGADPGDTPPDAPVEKLLFAPGVSAPKSDSELKGMGFTKLVKRDTGVYENVTASGKEKRYMTAGDASSLPDLKGKISD
jgi:predicted nucleic acid-binding Zn ribbon protein